MFNERIRNGQENKKLCEENPEFMMCPRCYGTKFIPTSNINNFSKECSYCNGNGVITWIDKIVRNMKNPFTEEVKK